MFFELIGAGFFLLYWVTLKSGIFVGITGANT